MTTYAPGHVPESAMTKISGAFLLTGTACAFAQWQAAVAKAGGSLSIVADGGYRDALKNQLMKKLYPQISNNSPHLYGLAADIHVSGITLDRAFAIGRQFGFSRPLWPGMASEINHAVHDGKTATKSPRAVVASSVQVAFAHAKKKLTVASKILWTNRIVKDPNQLAVLHKKLGIK